MYSTEPNDYNFWRNELIYSNTLSKPPTCSCLHAFPTGRYLFTMATSGLAFVYEGLDLATGSGAHVPSTGSIVTTALALSICAINILLSCCFCRNITDKERTYLLANQQPRDTIACAKICESTALILYPLIAVTHLSLLIWAIAKK